MKLDFTITRKTAFSLLILASVMLLPLLYSFGFIGDDHRIIFSAIKNPFPFSSDWTGSNVHLYRPLTILTVYINFLFSGLNPFPYYLGNLLIHLLSSFFIYDIFEHIESKDYKSKDPNLIFLI